MATQYRQEKGIQGLAWDGCISDGCLWLMDNGDIDSVRQIYGVHPNGRVKENTHLSWRSYTMDWQTKTFKA